MARPHVLVVDDEADLRTLMRLSLGRLGLEVTLAADLDEARQRLATQAYALCLTDMNLPDGNGLELVQDVATRWPEMPIAVITAYGSMTLAIDALKAGAFDFVSKPVDLPRLRELIQRALTLNQPEATPKLTLDEQLLLGRSAPMQQLRQTIRKLARSQAPVFLQGESGTGKEVVARLIHLLGPRSDGPFVPVNCGAIPSELMESEFFGHRKGSFTGATADKQGLFQSAHDGTLFLDEVADLPLDMQVKLLRAIQEKKVRPIGANEEIAVDVRILSATHKNLAAQVAAGGFRQDLFYRINVIEVRLPPLRERGQDILLMTEHFLSKLAQEWQIDPPTLSKAAQQQLVQFSFPGNVRELQNVLERALTLCEGQEIQPEHLMLPGLDDFPILVDESAPVLTPNSANSGVSITDGLSPRLSHLPPDGLDPFLVAIEKQLILQALDQTHWNRTAAARKLGITFRSLRHRLKKLGLDDSQDDDDLEG